MANTLATPDWVTFETARYFSNSLRGVGQFNRTYNDEYKQAGAKVGDTIRVRLPQQFEATEGESLQVQNLLDRTVNVILNRRRHVGFGYSSAQETLELQEIRERYVQPARSFDAARDAIGRPDLWFHDLRRSFVTNARRRGVPESVVMRMSGHRTRGVFDRYNVVDDRDVREAVRRIENAVMTE